MTREIVTTSKFDWATPQPLFDVWHEEFLFDVDMCARFYNHKLPRYWDEETDAFTQDWTKVRGFDNPPYFEIGRWLERALTAAREGGFSAHLIPANTDTQWFHRWVKHGQIDLFEGRIQFEDLTPADVEVARLLQVLEKTKEESRGGIVKKIADCYAGLPEKEIVGNEILHETREVLFSLGYSTFGKVKKKNGPGFPSMLVIFDPQLGFDPKPPRTRSAKTGALI